MSKEGTMTNLRRLFPSIQRSFRHTALAALFTLAMLPMQSAEAQTFTVLHSFTGGVDGGQPNAGLTIDRAGNLYGTTSSGGQLRTCQPEPQGCGTVFKLAHRNSGWVLSTLYSFYGGADGGTPLARVIFGSNGTLYGTASYGGDASCNSILGNGCGTAFNLRPPAHVCESVSCPWTETVIHTFSGGITDGANPLYGDLTSDHAGNVYGTTFDGGSQDGGTVFELVPSNNGWTESVLYNFTLSSPYGNGPASGVMLDQAGNIYGTTEFGGYCDGAGGVVYELTPSNRGWQENDLHIFSCLSDGGAPIGGLIFDQLGNLYGTDTINGAGGGGIAYELSQSNNEWILNSIYSFEQPSNRPLVISGDGPYSSLTMDAAGNLYGTTIADGAFGHGAVFKLTPSGGGWTYTSLHDFTGGSDGEYPVSSVIFDSNGNLYGTAAGGGSGARGVIWEITP